MILCRLNTPRMPSVPISLSCPMKIRRIHIPETDSTNSYIQQLGSPGIDEILTVTTDFQTAGRGQGSNHWESERGKNLLCSIKVCPTEIKPTRQFLLSEAGALAVAEALDDYTEGITLKWPNDIYWHDKKICGTLIETTMATGRLRTCVFGIGVNVNQQSFHSDAPNPVSLWQIRGCETDLEEVLRKILLSLQKYLFMLCCGEEETVSARYHSRLYRGKGFFPYRDAEGEFMAEIVGVADEGPITLRDMNGRLRTYAFKEVQFIV